MCLIVGSALVWCHCSLGSSGGTSTGSGESHLPAGEHPTLRWILACRVAGEGFGEYPGDNAFVSRTAMALEALEILGGLDALPDKPAIASWLRNLQNSDGGFVERPDFYRGKALPWGTQSALQPTYWAVRALRILGSEPADLEGVVRFVGERRRESGSYDASEIGWGGALDSVYSTFWAVGTLDALGQPFPQPEKVIAFLQEMQETNEDRGGFRLSVDNWPYSSVPGTSHAVQALALLGAGPRRPDDVKRYLLSSFGQEADGGFEIGHGDAWNNFDHYSLTAETYGAVLALHLLAKPLSDTDVSRATRPRTDCAAWLKGIQNPDGGFARVGVTEQTPVRSPSEIRATWQAVSALKLLGEDVPWPTDPAMPKNEVLAHQPKFLYPTIACDNPSEVWAYRRIAKPIYDHFYERTGSRLQALQGISRWVRAVVGPENASYLTGGRGVLHLGWGQCGQMSNLLQAMAVSVDFAVRYCFVVEDVNCEILVQEEGWDRPHWVLYIPFTNELPDPGVAAPDGTKNGWSLLDCVIDFHRRRKNLNFISRTLLGDRAFEKVRLETIDYSKGTWGREIEMDGSASYQSGFVAEAYPDRSW